ncbi:MAG: hypothetical protein ACD_19C00140G0005 [uncultured bacterium]|nr:MAG: hypothetical protein ACD_19C00140G0005 [uncultured bacterium]
MIKKIKRPTATLGELLAQWLLKGSELVRKPSHDISFRGDKIEVKSARPSLGGGQTRGWFFCVNKKAQKRWAKRFWFLCFNEFCQLERLYVVPTSEVIGNSTIWINKNWEQYRVE